MKSIFQNEITGKILLVLLILLIVPYIASEFYDMTEEKFLPENEACNTLSCFWNTSFNGEECRNNITHQDTACIFGQPSARMPIGKPIYMIGCIMISLGLLIFVIKWLFPKK